MNKHIETIENDFHFLDYILKKIELEIEQNYSDILDDEELDIWQINDIRSHISSDLSILELISRLLDLIEKHCASNKYENSNLIHKKLSELKQKNDDYYSEQKITQKLNELKAKQEARKQKQNIIKLDDVEDFDILEDFDFFDDFNIFDEFE